MPVWIDLQASKVSTGERDPKPRPEKLLEAWIRCLVTATAGHAVSGAIIGPDAWLMVQAPGQDEARQALDDLLQAWANSIQGRDGSAAEPSGPRPLPTALRTGMAFLADPDKASGVYEGTGFGAEGESQEACLARLYPDFESLTSDGEFQTWSQVLYEPLRNWIATAVSVHALPAVGADDDAAAVAADGAAA